MIMAAFVRLLVLVLFVEIVQNYMTNGEITCKDNDGNPIEWFVIYKLPRAVDSNSIPNEWQRHRHHEGSGVEYYYMDPNHLSWTYGGSINGSSGAVYNTLQQIYKNYKSPNVMYLMYNDDSPPHNVSYSHGHTKGDIAFDKSTGFWLVHSVPRFPPRASEEFAYPHSGELYGQSFLCVTYKYDMLNIIGSQLLYNYPQVYESNLPSNFKDNHNIADVLTETYSWCRDNKATNQTKALESATSSLQFMSFAKCGDEFNADLYHALVAPYYKKDLYAETWSLGPGKLGSDCSGSYKVLNVQDMDIDGKTFVSRKDHSKWAISQSESITCIGDINREEAQKKRNGGTVCFNIPEVWHSFKGAIQQTEKCHNTLNN